MNNMPENVDAELISEAQAHYDQRRDDLKSFGLTPEGVDNTLTYLGELLKIVQDKHD